MQCSLNVLANTRVFLALACGCVSLTVVHGQSQFSANALGYVDVSLHAGSNLVAHPFRGRDFSVSNLFRALPDGSFFLPWDGAAQQFGPVNLYSSGAGWSQPMMALRPPAGAFVWVPSPTVVTFSGEVPLPALSPCQQYPAGSWVLSVMPGGGVVCDLNGCHPAPPVDTIMSKWNRAAQSYETYTFVGVQAGVPTGWVDEQFNFADPQLAPDEAALFHVPESFPVCGFAQNDGTPPAGVKLLRPRREGSSFLFQFAAAAPATYAVLHATNVNAMIWRVVQEGTATPTNGLATVSVSGATQPAGFYCLFPFANVSVPVLLEETRLQTSFRFQFFAPGAGTYQVQRSPTIGDGAVWQTLQTFVVEAKSLVTVLDASATAARNHYRVRY